MTTPVNPNDPSSPPPPVPPSSGGDGAPSSFSSGGSSIDPNSVWSKFLSTPGHPASPKDVQMFINGLLKTLSLIIQEDARKARRAAERMKRAIKGE